MIDLPHSNYANNGVGIENYMTRFRLGTFFSYNDTLCIQLPNVTYKTVMHFLNSRKHSAPYKSKPIIVAVSQNNGSLETRVNLFALMFSL